MGKRGVYVLDLEGSVSNVVNDIVDLSGILCVHVREKPVVTNIGFNSPGQGQRAVFLSHVAEFGSRIRKSTRGTLEHDLMLAHVFHGGTLSLDWEVKSLADSVESLHWVREVSLLHWAGFGSRPGVERVSMRKDFAVLTNLVEVVISLQIKMQVIYTKSRLTLTLKSELSISMPCMV